MQLPTVDGALARADKARSVEYPCESHTNTSYLTSSLNSLSGCKSCDDQLGQQNIYKLSQLTPKSLVEGSSQSYFNDYTVIRKKKMDKNKCWELQEKNDFIA